jgi:elongator complex protein 3
LRDTKESIAQLKDLGFKLNFHIMPGLPTPSGERISKERDLESIKTILTETEYQPDMIKIYPCMVMQGTPLEQTYKQGVFTPLSTEEAADIIAESFRYVQPWCRVMRIQRDIPTYSTTAGVSKTNLRQYVDVLLKQRGIVSQDIRAREPRDQKLTSQPSIVVRTYPASNGTEYFISLETEQTLFGFARLRFVGSSIHPLIPTNAALLRELHVYGHTVRIGTKDTQAIQHQGFGKQLMRKAEEICKEHGKSKLLVISGVGVREYYKKIGYNKEGPYMVKYFTGAHDTTL